MAIYSFISRRYIKDNQSDISSDQGYIDSSGEALVYCNTSS